MPAGIVWYGTWYIVHVRVGARRSEPTPGISGIANPYEYPASTIIHRDYHLSSHVHLRLDIVSMPSEQEARMAAKRKQRERRAQGSCSDDEHDIGILGANAGEGGGAVPAPVLAAPHPPPPGPPPASLGSFDAARTMPKRPLASPKTGAERAFELLSFDTIDERPAAEESYDLLDKILGKGVANKADAFYLPYLQTGHVFMLLVLLLACSVTYPGFPLTQVPADYRELLQQGLAVTFVVNTGCAWYSRGVAAKKRESVWFWMVKCFLLGGLALGELVNAVPDPAKAAPTRR